MKKINKTQSEVNFQIMKMSIDSEDEDTRIALLSASAAFHNYIQFGVETKSIYGCELLHDDPLK